MVGFAAEARQDEHRECIKTVSSRVKVLETARDLGVIIDSQMSLSAQMTAVCSSGYYQLW